MHKNSFIFIFLIANIAIGFCQMEITTEKIWKDHAFYANSVPGFNFKNNGKHYTRLEANAIVTYDITTGQIVGTPINGEDLNIDGKISAYQYNQDESKIMIQTKRENIYRRSSKAYHYIYDVAQKTISPVHDKKISAATLNDQGDKVAYILDNNLYYKNLRTGETVQVTFDGKQNKVINGMADWVYEEEFGQVKYYEWSPNGGEIGFIKFDESQVPSFTMTNYNDNSYPTYQTFKYPKVGEKNAIVSAHIYSLKDQKTREIDTGDNGDIYMPRIKWSPNGNLVIFKLNRHQNHLELLKVSTMGSATTTLLEEKNKYYINIHDNLTFIDDGFLWTSEQDGYNHIYLYDNQGNVKDQLTRGDFEVQEFYGYDAKDRNIYYRSNERSVLGSDVYALNIDSKKKVRLSPNVGYNSAHFSDTFDYYVLNNSTINRAPTYTVYDKNAEPVRTIEDNATMESIQSLYTTVPIEFIQIPIEDKTELNAFIMKPKNFDPNEKYPLMLVQYSGPGSQSVVNRWKGNNYWWYQQLVQQGFIVACVDPRGTGGRGEAFTKMTYLNLGHYETLDLIASAKYLSNKPYIDKDKIGIFGWSYGGYMSSLAILKGNDTFAAAVAVAPVTNWKWYDTIYTERYMRTLAENKKGYEENSPVYFADLLKGDYLLIHGMSDDNVHFQNSVEMAEALIRANKQFDTYFYPNRNHGIYGNNARLHLYTKINNFLKKHLLEQ